MLATLLRETAKTVLKMNSLILVLFLGTTVALAEIHVRAVGICYVKPNTDSYTHKRFVSLSLRFCAGQLMKSLQNLNPVFRSIPLANPTSQPYKITKSSSHSKLKFLLPAPVFSSNLECHQERGANHVDFCSKSEFFKHVQGHLVDYYDPKMSHIIFENYLYMRYSCVQEYCVPMGGGVLPEQLGGGVEFSSQNPYPIIL